MWVVILVFVLSKPDETPPAFGIIAEFNSNSECVQAIAKMDISDDQRSRLHCMELRKPKEI